MQLMDSPRMLGTTLIIFAGLALIVFFSTARSPSVPSWLLFAGKTNPTSSTRHVEKWNSWTTRAAEWELRLGDRDYKNWAGRQKMNKMRSKGSLWWDESAEQYFQSKLENNQFRTNCSEAHLIAHYDFVSGLMSTVHVFFLPLFFAMVRGHPLVPMSEPKHHPAFDGCGPNITDRNMMCYFNVTNCNPVGSGDPRLEQILAEPMQHNNQRTTWAEVLMEDDEFFSPGGVTVIQTWRWPTWDTRACVGSSIFSSLSDAYTYHKLSLWNGMGRHGKVGVVTSSADNTTRRVSRKCSANEREDLQDSSRRRVDMVMVSLMSSWMLNQLPNNVRLVADEIMSRYVDKLGQPLWKPPVVAIHIRQTDKSNEDPYFSEHGVYRPVEDYALQMKKMEGEYGFQWPSIFLISDSGTARETFVAYLSGKDSLAAPAPAPQLQEDGKRYIMYDWMVDDHLQDKYQDHTKVPKNLKYDMQVHFLATLYIVEKIADHAIVTYSSNVGRFIGEIMTAKHRLAFADRRGPLVTSLDSAWYWT